MFLENPVALLHERRDVYAKTEEEVELKLRNKRVLFCLLRSYWFLDEKIFDEDFDYEKEWEEVKVEMERGIFTFFAVNLLFFLQKYEDLNILKSVQ